MRAKPISFAEVIKSKSRVSERDPTPQSSLFQIMERYEDNPDEDYTLFLGPNSLQPRSKTSSFRALNSRNQCEGSQMFDSWIQRQSFVGSKQNSQRNMINSNRSQTTHSKDTKKSFIAPQTKEGKEPIKSVADLVKKIESNDKENSNMPFFRAGPKVQTQRQKPQFQKVTRVPPQRNIQFHDNQQDDQDIKINLIKPKQERPTARPYIEMPTVVKQRPVEKEKERVDLDDLLLKTENIHIEIAELAQKYKQEQAKEHEQMEDSLLIQDSSKKESGPEVIISPIQEPKKFDAKADDAQWMRWETAKSKINNYFQKITTQDQPKLPSKIENSQQNRQISSQSNNQSVGYSFAVNEIEPICKQDFHLSSLQSITIPKIQQIQSQRLPFEKIQQKSEQFQQCHYSPTFIEKEEEVYQQYHHHNYEYVSPPKMEEKGSNEAYELQEKIVGSSLVFSSNVKGASPSQSSKQGNSQKRSGQKSDNERVSLSFTEEKPIYVQNVNIQPTSSKKSQEYQIQTIKVNQESFEKPSLNDSSSPKQEIQESYKETLNIDIKPRDYNEYRTQNRSFSIDNWEYKKQTPQITIKIDSCFNIEAQTNNYQPLSLKESFKQESLKQSLNSEQQFKPLRPTQPVYIQAYSKNNQQQFNQTLSPVLIDNHLMKKSIQIVEQPKNIITASNNLQNDQLKFDFNDEIAKKGSLNAIKSSSKSSGVKNSPPNSLYGLKKVYCSPKTDTVTPQVQPITSAFTTINEPKAKIESIIHKSNFEIKPAAIITKAWDMKIDTIAYNRLQPMKQSKQIANSNVQEEGEQFQFDL